MSYALHKCHYNIYLFGENKSPDTASLKLAIVECLIHTTRKKRFQRFQHKCSCTGSNNFILPVAWNLKTFIVQHSLQCFPTGHKTAYDTMSLKSPRRLDCEATFRHSTFVLTVLPRCSSFYFWCSADSDLHVRCWKTKTARNHICDLVRDKFMYLSVNAMLYPNCTHLMEIGTVPPVLLLCCVKNIFFSSGDSVAGISDVNLCYQMNK